MHAILRTNLLVALLASSALLAGASAQPPPDAAMPPVSAEQAAAAPAPAFSEARSLEEAFFHLQVAVGRLNEASASNPRLDPNAVEGVGNTINVLQDLFRQSEGTSPGADYVVNLDHQANVIAALATEDDAGAANASLTMLQRDLDLKIASARATLGATGLIPGSIPVTVTTQRTGRSVGGYLVRAAAALYSGSPPIYAFNNPTNPSTTSRLVPGLYVFHAYDRSGREVEVVNPELGVGLDGADSADLILMLR